MTPHGTFGFRARGYHLHSNRAEKEVANGDSRYLDLYGAVPGSADLTGYGVEALDGGIGKIDEASNDVGASYVVVDTGPWIFGKKVLLPAGVISRLDAADEKVYVNRTKEQIKNSPEFDPDSYRDQTYRERARRVLRPRRAGWQDW